MDRKKICVLGAAGFIGTNLSFRLLREDKYRLLCIDLPGKDMSFMEELGAEVVYGSVIDQDEKVYEAISDSDILFHLVSTTCPTNSNNYLADELRDNSLQTVKLFDECVKRNVKRVVFLSSGGTVYGREHNGVLKESDNTYPISGYGIQKLIIEKYLYLYRELYGLDYRIVRLSNPYGPYQRPDGVQGLVAACTYKLLKNEPVTIFGDGSVIRDYIYIDDAVEGIVNISFGESLYRLYNLGSGKGLSVKDIVDNVSRVLNIRPVINFEKARQVDVSVNVLDITRYMSEFGNPVTIEMDEGIWRLAKFYERIQ